MVCSSARLTEVTYGIVSTMNLDDQIHEMYKYCGYTSIKVKFK